MSTQSQALPAMVSFLCPGLGQLIQGRIGAALGWFVGFWLSVFACLFIIGFLTTPIVWLVCVMDAANYKPRR
jgi:TM2 domain-containing membrane protein YozV